MHAQPNQLRIRLEKGYRLLFVVTGMKASEGASVELIDEKTILRK